jgi:hypothetical protein
MEMGQKPSPIERQQLNPGGLKPVVYLRGVLIGLLETKMTTAGASKMKLFAATNLSALILAGLEL